MFSKPNPPPSILIGSRLQQKENFLAEARKKTRKSARGTEKEEGTEAREDEVGGNQSIAGFIRHGGETGLDGGIGRGGIISSEGIGSVDGESLDGIGDYPVGFTDVG